MDMTRSLKVKMKEFQDHVWDHTVDPFQASFETPSAMPHNFIESLVETSCMIQKEDSDELIIKKIHKDVHKNTVLYFEKILQICGLTRSKIITDLKAMKQNGGIPVKIPSSYSSLPNSDAWTLAGMYLIKRLKSVIFFLCDTRKPAQALNAINRATWPGWIRQERAKRSGHEAEGRLARIFFDLGIPFEPKEKAKNPLYPDAQIYGISFDLVIPSIKNPSIVVKATIHTANIGRYGESKDHLEIVEAKKMLAENYPESKRPVLLAFMNGVGCMSNRAGLEGVLSKSDEFCQYDTLWKSVIIANNKLGGINKLKINISESTRREYVDFFKKYNWKDDRFSSLADADSFTEAGSAKFFIETN